MKPIRNREWEAHTNLKDGFVRIEFADGEELTVKNDGVTGYDFVTEYLQEMEEHYSGHLAAADMLLKQQTGPAYKTIRQSAPARYRSELALVSLNCVFGREDEIPDHEKDGTFHPEFVPCKDRYRCPYNGYREELKDKAIVCCNPIYECGLTRKQAQLADLMANTSLSYEDMALAMGCSYSNIDNQRKRIFAQLGVSSRPEISQMLRGKRLF